MTKSLLVLVFFLAQASLSSSANADQPSRADIAAMEACLTETRHVGATDHCTGVLSKACINRGEASQLTCLQREMWVWNAILSEVWPYRCGTCKQTSLNAGIRANMLRRDGKCPNSELGFARCMMEDTAFHAARLFREYAD